VKHKYGYAIMRQCDCATQYTCTLHSLDRWDWELRVN